MFLVFQMAESLPREVLKDCMDEKWGKIKMFKQCMTQRKAMACMEKDMKDMLEEHFSPLNELVEETGMEEKMLLPLTKALIDDSFKI